MKREVITFQFPKSKRRIPELFSEDTPFKPKVQKRKDQYQRKPKYRTSEFE
jgi:hypothetical protein